MTHRQRLQGTSLTHPLKYTLETLLNSHLNESLGSRYQIRWLNERSKTKIIKFQKKMKFIEQCYVNVIFSVG